MKLSTLSTHITAGALLVLAGVALGPAFAHSGGMGADGAHMKRTTGVRHWHLEVPCMEKPCRTGVMPSQFIEVFDPIPDDCPGLHDRIVAEADKSYWNRSEARVAEWAYEGIRAGCWRVPRAPPRGESHR